MSVERKVKEFHDYVWNHAEDVFQAKFDVCAELTDEECESIQDILAPTNLQSVKALANSIKAAHAESPALLRKLLQLAGLTRNKILQDIKAYVRNNNLVVSLSSPESLFRDRRGIALGSEYLARQLLRVFGHSHDVVSGSTLEAINQATWPGYIRQERAKRSGHEAEYRLACLLRDCDIPFAPEAKAENPLCRDVLIGGMSYDLVAPSVENALLRVVATVHTANIGQYGESKDDLEVRKALAEIGDREDVVLLAFIDGVGFESNRAGLTGVLENAHEFCQFRTIWKAGVIAGYVTGKSVTVALPEKERARFKNFCEAYGARIVASEYLGDAPAGWVSAGMGFLRTTPF